MSNSAPDGVITMEFANRGILNEEMRRNYSVALHTKMSWSQKSGGKFGVEIRVMEVITVVVPPNEILLMLSVIIVVIKVT